MRIQRSLMTATWLVLSLSARAQPEVTSAIFERTHGLIRETATLYEIEGHAVVVQDMDLGFDEKGFKKVLRTYKRPREAFLSVDSLLRTEHRVIRTAAADGDGSEGHATRYVFPRGEHKVRVVDFVTLVRPDPELERFFAQAAATGTIPGSVYTDHSLAVDSVPFAGRRIGLGSACRWMSPHNVQCPDLGQINWSECRSLERAREIVEAQFAWTAAKTLVKVREREEVDILFEGVPTKAIRSVTKIQVPQVVMMGSNVLVVYYVVQEVRGRYVACVLSHYTDDVDQPNDLPPLLREVIELK
jgi:hypothetical protein